jgi:hypothetical protein
MSDRIQQVGDMDRYYILVAMGGKEGLLYLQPVAHLSAE